METAENPHSAAILPTPGRFRNWISHRHVLWAAMAFSLTATGVCWYALSSFNKARVVDRFSVINKDLCRSIDERLRSYHHLLLGTKGLVVATEGANWASWNAYVRNLDLETTFPGVRVLGYSRLLPAPNDKTFVEWAKREVSPDFAVWPQHKRNEHHAVTFVAPLDDQSRRSIGYDMMTDPPRRAAMKRARDLGEVTISGGAYPKELERGEPTKSFVMFVPVYKQGFPIGNQEQRRAANIGFVYAVFRIDSFLGGMVSPEDSGVDFQIYDIPDPKPQHLLYSSPQPKPSLRPEQELRRMNFGFHEWTLQFTTRQNFTSTFERFISPGFAVAGLLINLMLYVTLRTFARQRRMALDLASSMTTDLRKEIEQRRELYERLTKLSSQVPGVVFQMRLSDDDSLQFPYASGQLMDYFGLSPQAAAQNGNAVLDCVYSEDLAGFRNSLHKSAQHLSVWRYEFRVMTPQQGVRWLLSNGTPTPMPDASVLWHGVFTDVTHMKQAESEAHRALAELSYQKFAMDQHAIVSMADTNGRITYVNDRFCSVTGFTRQELTGGSYELIAAQAFQRDFFMLVQPVMLRGEVWHGELRAKSKKGDMRCLETSVVPFCDESGAVDRFVTISTDITERKQLEDSLQAARDEAYEASRLKSRFLASVSHEIRTPMNGILGMGDLLLRSHLEPRQREMAMVLTTSAQSLMRIIDDILDFSKVEAGKIQLEKAGFRVSYLLKGVCRLMEAKALEKRLSLQLVCPEELDAVVLGDAGRLRQVLLNLVGNAVKFTDKGSVRVDAAVTESKAENLSICIKIIDTGVGIAEESKPLLFRPFAQADHGKGRQFGGTGLGLAISHQLVELMGGRLGFESTQGKGTEFKLELSLPRGTQGDCEEQPVASQSMGMGGPGGLSRRLHFLVADDTAANRLVVSRMLDKLGCSYDVVCDGLQALERLKDGQYDGVLMDCQMPELDGYEATRRLRAGVVGERGRKLPVIALTAYAMPGDRDRCLEAGMSDYVGKPVTFAALMGAIERCGLAGVVKPCEAPLPEVRTVTTPAFCEEQWKVLEGLPTGNGHTALQDALKLFAANIPAELEGLRSCIERSEYGAAEKLAHMIASSSASVGAMSMRRTALALESMLSKPAAAPGAAVLLAELDEQWRACVAYIEQKGVLKT